MASNGLNTQPKPGFTNTLSAYVTMIGYSAGMADFWRFPFLVYRNGGGAFLIPFTLTTCICGIPMYFLEYNIANFSGKGPYKVWDISPLFRGIGVAIFSAMTVYYIGATVFRAWLVYFFVNSFSNPLPWTHCNNTWNTNTCLARPFLEDSPTIVIHNMTRAVNNSSSVKIAIGTSNMAKMTAAEEFWQHETLRLSNGFTDIGIFNWQIFLCIVAFRILIFLCMIKSIKSIEKVMYFTTSIQFLLTVVVFIRSLLQPGASDGLQRFFMTDFSKLDKPRVWIEAFLMSFYTMSFGLGPVISIGSQAKLRENSIRSAILIPLIDAFIAMMTGVVCFSVLGNMAHAYGVAINNVINAAMSLGLVSYITALSSLPLPQLWSAMFFLSVILSGIDSQVVPNEMCVQIMGEMFPKLFPRYRLLTVILYNVVLAVFALPTATGAGAYIFLWNDWYVGVWSGPICAFLEIIAIVWVYGIDRFSNDITLMIGRPIPAVIRITLAFVTPCLVMVIFLTSLVEYAPPKYGSYKFPDWARALGWLVVTCIIAPIPIVALRQVYKQAGGCKEKFQFATRINANWGPKEKSVAEEFRQNESKLKSRTTIQVLYFAIFGQYKGGAEPVPQNELSSFNGLTN